MSASITLPSIGSTPIGGAVIETVDARELHAFLGVGRDFTTWIKERLAAYGFAESVDFTTYQTAPQNGGAGNRGLRTEYAITLDTAKELSMVERTDRGRQARRYFIECERKLKSVTVTDLPRVPQTLPEALRLAADLAERVEAQRAEIAVLEPRSEALATIADAEGALSLTLAAKHLQVRPSDLIAYLVREGWLYRRDNVLVAYQARLNARLMTHKVVAVASDFGRRVVRYQPLVTPKGLAELGRLFTVERPPRLPLFVPTAPASA